MRILITGAGGFIGSHVVEYFVDKGYKVEALIEYNSDSNIGNLNHLPKDKIKKLNYILEILEIVIIF